MNKSIYLPSSFLLFILCTLGTSNAQSIAISSGMGSTHYFSILGDKHSASNYESGESYFVKVDFTDMGENPLTNNLAFRFEKQSGKINHSSNFMFCGIGYSPEFSYAQEYINKYTLGIASYPISYTINNYLTIRAGAAINKTISFKTKNGSDLINTRVASPFESGLSNRSFTSDAIFEIQFYKIDIGKGLTVFPTYNASLNLTTELDSFHNTQSFRHSLGLAVLWGIKKKS